MSSSYFTVFVEQCCQVPKLFSGQYIKKLWPISDKFRLILQKRQFNIHTKGQFEMKLKFFFVPESVSVPLNKELL
jgi:hypothetical protein